MDATETKSDVDLGLAICAVKHRGEPLPLRTIAAYAGCHRSYIEQVERRALAKVRKALKRQGIIQEVVM